MFLPKKYAKFTYLILFLISSFIVTTNNIVVAHTIKISKNVGATLHLEPDDTPSAGEVSQAWFALTRQGGKVIPLKDCNCQLSIYTEPHDSKKAALFKPTLKPIQAERYEGIPGADITFPKPGNYLLQLTGKPIKEEDFQPFDLQFTVTVAAGKSINTKIIKQSLNRVPKNRESFSLLSIIFLGTGIILVSLFFVVQLRKRN